MNTRLEIASNAAREAGLFLRESFQRDTDVRYKDAERCNPASSADKGAEDIIIRLLTARFPEDGILSEERGRAGKPSDYTWIIDPLDGTVNYIHGYRNFAVSIAFSYCDEVVLGVIFNPLSEELFTAEKDKGACLNGRPTHVSRITDLRESLIGISFPYERDSEDFRRSLDYQVFLTRTAQAVRRDGSTALALCNVACGRFEALCVAGNAPWDYAAGVLMVAEAGGRVTDLQGGPFRLSRGHVLATNGLIHEAVIKCLQQRTRTH